MDLEDLLEDLVKRAQRSGRQALKGPGPRKGRARAALLRAGAAVTGVAAATSAGVGGTIMVLAEGGVLDAVGAGGLVTGGVLGIGAWAAARAGRRRDPRRADSRRDARRLAKLPEAERFRGSDLPKPVRGDWARLMQARRLVADLSSDGWIDVDARESVDDEITRLGHLLVADKRTTDVGGAANHTVREQVGELADLLVALADEAVQHQAAAGRDGRVPATLTEAHDRLVSLREAREVVERIDRAQSGTVQAPGADRGATGTSLPSAGEAGSDARRQPPPPRPMPG